MTTPSQMIESDFHRRADKILESVEMALDDAGSDVDSVLQGGVLTLEFENGSKIVINRQTPAREIWVATPSGGFHFRYHEGKWRNTRDQQTLECLLSAEISMLANRVIDITF